VTAGKYTAGVRIVGPLSFQHHPCSDLCHWLLIGSESAENYFLEMYAALLEALYKCSIAVNDALLQIILTRIVSCDKLLNCVSFLFDWVLLLFAF